MFFCQAIRSAPGSRSRTRTYDRAINSRLLYQLSYSGSPARPYTPLPRPRKPRGQGSGVSFQSSDQVSTCLGPTPHAILRARKTQAETPPSAGVLKTWPAKPPSLARNPPKNPSLNTDPPPAPPPCRQNPRNPRRSTPPPAAAPSPCADTTPRL